MGVPKLSQGLVMENSDEHGMTWQMNDCCGIDLLWHHVELPVRRAGENVVAVLEDALQGLVKALDHVWVGGRSRRLAHPWETARGDERVGWHGWGGAQCVSEERASVAG